MTSLLAQIGFDPEIRGALVVAVGVIVLFGSIWMIMATNQGARLAALLCIAAFFGWMVIMGAFWWIRGIGFVGDSVSWVVQDFNRTDITESSVERARDLPIAEDLDGLGIAIANFGMAEGVEEMSEFVDEFDEFSDEAAQMTADEITAETIRQLQRNDSTTISQVFSVAPDFVEQAFAAGEITGLDGQSRQVPSLNGWEIMSTGEAGEAQTTAGAAILEEEGFPFDSQAEFRFLEAFRTGGKPRLDRDIDLLCTFCTDNLRRGWHWIANSARIRNPTEYSVVQLQAIDAEALITREGEAPPFPRVDEDAPVISVVMVRELGNLRFPPAMITLGSLLIFTALVYLLHFRDIATMKRVEAFAIEG